MLNFRLIEGVVYSMSRKSILWIALICALMIALVGLSGCRGTEEVVVVPPPVEEPELEPEPVYWPFTGLEADDEEAILARPMSVKIENSPQSRPQSGLNAADVVYETITEGGITRFNAIYQSEIIDSVGPVRSARLSDVWIVPQFGNGLFLYSGCSGPIRTALDNAGITNMSHGLMGNTIFNQDNPRFSPHNLYLNLSMVYDAAEERGYDIVTEDPVVGLDFQSLTEENPSFAAVQTSATHVNVPFSPSYNMDWSWNAEDELWERSTNGIEQTDLDTEERITTNNLIVVWAQHTQTGYRDSAGSSTYDIALGGEGRASIFMDGTRIDGTWTATASTPPTFTDPRGDTILLVPGRTWISVLLPDIDINVEGESEEVENLTGYGAD